MILIDFSQFARACLYASQLDSDADVNFMKHMIMTSIKNINVKNRDQYGRVVICCDGGKYWRRDLFEHYKGKRRESRQKASEHEKKIEAIFFRAKDELIEELGENTPWFVIRVPKLEADDIIAILTQTEGRHLIVSSDHDFKQLHSQTVHQLCPRSGKNVVAEDPQRYLFEHIMKGDTGDGIPNILSDSDTLMVDGKRQKPMKKTLIEEAWEHYQQQGDDALRSFLNERCGESAADNFFDRNRVLVDLQYASTDCEQTNEWKREIHRQMKQQKEAYTGSSKLMKYLAKNKMDRLLDQLNDFSHQSPGALI